MTTDPMSKEEVLGRLRGLHQKSERAADLLSESNISAEAEAELRLLVPQLKNEIRTEYKRMSPMSFQESIGAEEAAFFLAIQEAWADTGLSGLRIEGRPKTHWHPILEAVNAKLHYYLHELESSS